MRAYRRILISNGMTNIPAKVSSISTKGTISLSETCPDCNGDIGRKKVCKNESCQYHNEIDSKIVLKAYKESKDSKVILSDDQQKLLKDKELKVEVIGNLPDKLELTTNTRSEFPNPANSMVNGFVLLAFSSTQMK